MLEARLGRLPIAYGGDVDAALLGEVAYGEAKDQEDYVLMKIGTGIGVAAMSGGRLVSSSNRGTPEMGHLIIKRDADDAFTGACPAHGDCLEGLASGGAHKKRQEQGEDLDWDRQARYIGLGVHNAVYSHRPSVMMLGGGVMAHEGLFDAVRDQVVNLNKGYLELPEFFLSKDGERMGVKGAFRLAMSAVALRGNNAQ